MRTLAGMALLTVSLFAADGDAVKYVCPGGESFTVRYQGEKKTNRGTRAPRAVVEAEGKPPVALPQVISGSGARFSDGYTTLWNKGNEATLESGSLNAKACKASSEGVTLTLSGRWILTEIEGQSVNLPRPAYMEFMQEGDRVAGSAGCNRFTGAYKLDGATLKFGPAAATRMACVGPGMEIESKFFKMMEATASVRKSGDTLALLDESGKVLASFKQD